jgi:G:T-mismatch repair DNA endonuclease (very short patch repair protein)
MAALIAEGWRVLIIWECEISKAQMLARCLARFLGPPKQNRIHH